MRVAAVSAPKNTLFFEYFIARMVVITNVLSPNSETNIQNNAARKPLLGHGLMFAVDTTGDDVDAVDSVSSIRLDILLDRCCLLTHTNTHASNE